MNEKYLRTLVEKLTGKENLGLNPQPDEANI